MGRREAVSLIRHARLAHFSRKLSLPVRPQA